MLIEWFSKKIFLYMDRNINYYSIDIQEYEHFLVSNNLRRVNIIYELNKEEIDFVAITLLADFVYNTNITKIKIDGFILEKLNEFKNCARTLRNISFMLSYCNNSENPKLNKKIINKNTLNVNFKFMIEAYRVTQDTKDNFNSLIQKELLNKKCSLAKNRLSIIKKI